MMKSHVEQFCIVFREMKVGRDQAAVWLSPKDHGAAWGRLLEPRSSENSRWNKSAAVLQYKHEVACRERDNN